jgi:phosphate transport system protein
MSKDFVEKMVDKVMLVVRTSIEALRDNDSEMARTLAQTEKDVDSIYSEYLDKLFKAPPGTKCLIGTVLAVRYLERIAYHATCIGESIYYIAAGKRLFSGEGRKL